MQAIFEHKPDFRFRDFVIEKTVELPEEEFRQMLHHPMGEQDFIKNNRELMKQDDKGIYHCMLVTGEGRPDGLLVESEGYGYARYASYVPEATALRYPSLAKMNQELAAAVEFIVRDGISQTREGNWSLSFMELEEKNGLHVKDRPFLQELLDCMLSERPEVAEVQIEDDRFDVCYHLDFCANCREETEENEAEEKRLAKNHQPRLSDLLTTHWENVHLLYEDMDAVPHTIAELDSNTLTAEGKEAWADVLGAQVVRVYDGFYGLQVELTGVRGAAMLGGYCSVDEYEAWVNEEDDQNDLAMTET